ncbi:MAG: hypothetical protein ACOVKN_05260 [Arenimonas sp.]
MPAADLKTALKANTAHSEPSAIRLHRAISWLARAEQEAEDPDARFIFLWIALNAAYAKQFGFERVERGNLQNFIDTLLQVDQGGSLKQVVFSQFSGPIRVLINNKYIFEGFWKALRDHDASDRWSTDFSTANARAMQAVMANQTGVVLSIVFDRLYVLRNQLVHGGATWNSQVNRAQISDGANILGRLVPLIIELMIEHPELDFGEILYPPIAPM